jgi:hypothetical protein
MGVFARGKKTGEDKRKIKDRGEEDGGRRWKIKDRGVKISSIFKSG